MNDKAIIYYRTATEDKETKAKLAWQKQICWDYAKSKGYEVIKVLTEVESGMNFNRPELLKLTKAVKANKVRHIIVTNPDRISRNELYFALFKNLLKRQKVQLEYAQFNISGADEMLLSGILESMAAYYSKVHSQRVKRGIFKAKRRKSTCGSIFARRLHKILLKLKK